MHGHAANFRQSPFMYVVLIIEVGVLKGGFSCHGEPVHFARRRINGRHDFHIAADRWFRDRTCGAAFAARSPTCNAVAAGGIAELGETIKQVVAAIRRSVDFVVGVLVAARGAVPRWALRV